VSGCYVSRYFTVNPNPSFIQGPASFCSNSIDSLYSLTSGGTWNTTPGSVATVFSTAGNIYGLTGGTVHVTYTLPTGCFTTRTITSHPAPAPVITFNLPATTFNTANNYVSYQWYFNGSPIPGGTTPSVGAPYDGVYTVHVVDTLGCESTSQPYNLMNVGVHDLVNATSVAISPNPATEVLNIESPVALNVTVVTIDGRVVLTASQAKQVDISTLSPGMYLARLTDNEGRSVGTRKFQKM
jgi:hypothetical protein